MRTQRGLRTAILTATAVVLTIVRGSAAAPDVVRDVPRDYPTIQAALDASSAGDTMMVYAGVSQRTCGRITIGRAAHGRGR